MRASWYEPTLRDSPPPRSAHAPDERGEHGERAVEHRPVLVVLGADQRADRGRPDRAVVGRERLDDRWVEAADGAGPLRRPPGDVGGQLVEAERVGGDPVRVDQAVADEHVHHRQHQCDVGARQRLDELVGGVGRGRADRVDDDELGARGPGGLDGRPQVTVGQPGVGAPEQDQPAVAELHRVEAETAAVGHPHAVAHRGAADRADQPARPEVVEEAAVEAHDRQQALVAGIAERQDRLGAVLGDDRVEPVCDLAQGVVPRDRLEVAGALRPDAAQGMEDPVRAVDAVEEAVHLRAQLALAERMVGSAAELHRPPVGDGDLPPARVGAVVVAGAMDHLGAGHGREARRSAP